MTKADPGSRPTLELEIEYCPGDMAIVRCHGRLVAGTAASLFTRVDELMPEIQRVVLDLSRVSYTDSIGLGTLVRIYVTARAAGCTLELVNLSQQIRHLLGITNVLEVLPVISEESLGFS